MQCCFQKSHNIAKRMSCMYKRDRNGAKWHRGKVKYLTATNIAVTTANTMLMILS